MNPTPLQVHWHEGLFLQAHHLQCMQRSLVESVRALRSLMMPFGYGVVDWKLDESALNTRQLVRFEKLRVIMPSGQEVDAPGNADLADLDIRGDVERENRSIEVLLAVPLWTEDGANASRLGEPGDPLHGRLYVPYPKDRVRDENTGDKAQRILLRKVSARLVVAAAASSLRRTETLPVLRVSCPAGKTRLSLEDYVPPSLLLRSSPRLSELMKQLRGELGAYRAETEGRLRAGGLGAEVRSDLKLRLLVLNRAWGRLALDMDEAWMTSPYNVYLELTALLGELLALNPDGAGLAGFNPPPYDHNEPLPVFLKLESDIQAQFRVAPGVQVQEVKFEGKPGKDGALRASLSKLDFAVEPGAYYLGVRGKNDRSKVVAFVKDRGKFKVVEDDRLAKVAGGFGILLRLVENAAARGLPTHEDACFFELLHDGVGAETWQRIVKHPAQTMVLSWANADLDFDRTVFTLYKIPPDKP